MIKEVWQALMPVEEKIYWIISAISIVLAFLCSSEVLLFVLWAVLCASITIIDIIIGAKSEFNTHMYNIYVKKHKHRFATVKILEEILEEIEAGRLIVNSEEIKYLRSKKRLWKYANIPIIILTVIVFTKIL